MPPHQRQISSSPGEGSSQRNSTVRRYAQAPIERPLYFRKRIALMGARGVGKTALIIQCTQNRFERDYHFTIEATYRWLTTIDGVPHDIRLVDTDGQDENSFFWPQYTIGVDGYIFVYSVRDRNSFEIVKAINNKILDTLTILDQKGTKELPRILVGNQIDIPQEREVPYERAERYASQQEIPYFETSACSGRNVKEVFTEIINIIRRNSRLARNVDELSDQQNIEGDALGPERSSSICSRCMPQ